MFTENTWYSCKYSRMEIKNVNKEIVNWLEDIIEENNRATIKYKKKKECC